MLENQEILDNFSEGFCRWTPDLRLLEANTAFIDCLFPDAGVPVSGIFAAASSSNSFCQLCRAVMPHVDRLNVCRNFELSLLGENGRHRWLDISARRVVDADGTVRYYEAFVKDTSELKVKEAELEHVLCYDSLTGLPKRELFADKLQTALHASKRFPTTHYAVLCIDLFDFRNINAHYGRNFGDMLLRHAANTIQTCCRAVDTVARYAGDEFAVLLHGPHTGAEIVRIIKRIAEKLCNPFSAWGNTINAVKAHSGVIFPINEYNRAESVLRDVELAVDKAKTSRSVLGCKFYSRKMLMETHDKRTLALLLHNLRDLDDFYLDYQPIVRMDNGCLTSMEALVRWKLEGKIVPPSHFIPTAERTGFIEKLGVAIMEKSCRQLWYWQDAFGTDIELHVNISAMQLSMPVFPEIVQDILRKTGVMPSRLILEVTESVFLRDFNNVLHNVNALRRLGIRFCLDDFGTGYSSLSYLKHLPIAGLKIDRSFIIDLESDEKAQALLRHIIAIGRDMGFSLVVEGVERATQMELMGDLDHLLAQGYYFFKPLEVNAAEELIEKQRRRAGNGYD
jgi:diguanylate cyclase (GGDEF)-like protein